MPHHRKRRSYQKERKREREKERGEREREREKQKKAIEAAREERLPIMERETMRVGEREGEKERR